MCFELADLVTDSSQECRNYEKAFRLMTNPDNWFQINASTYSLPPAVGGRHVGRFKMLGSWSDGTRYVVDEFVQDVYRMGEMGFGAGDLLVDLGGNIGFFSVTAAKMCPELVVVTVEANPINFLFAYHNVEANGLSDRVKVINRALTADGSDLAIGYDYVNPGGSHGSYAVDKKHFEEFAKQSNNFIVGGTTMDELTHVGNHSTEKQFALKMDCEGCEYSAIDWLRAHEGRLKVLRGELHDIHPNKTREWMSLAISFIRKHDPLFLCTWCPAV